MYAGWALHALTLVTSTFLERLGADPPWSLTRKSLYSYRNWVASAHIAEAARVVAISLAFFDGLGQALH